MSSREQKLKKLKPKRVLSPWAEKEQTEYRKDLRELRRLQQQNLVLEHAIEMVQERISVMNVMQTHENECFQVMSQLRDQFMMREAVRPFISREADNRPNEEKRQSIFHCVDRMASWFQTISFERQIRQHQQQGIDRFRMEQKQQILELQPKIREQFFNQLRNLGISQELIVLNRSDTAGDFNSFLSSIVDYEKSSRQHKGFKKFVAGESNRNQRNPQIQTQSEEEQIQDDIEQSEVSKEDLDNEDTMTIRRRHFQATFANYVLEQNQRNERRQGNTIYEDLMQKLRGCYSCFLSLARWAFSMVEFGNRFDYRMQRFQRQ